MSSKTISLIDSQSKTRSRAELRSVNIFCILSTEYYVMHSAIKKCEITPPPIQENRFQTFSLLSSQHYNRSLLLPAPQRNRNDASTHNNAQFLCSYRFLLIIFTVYHQNVYTSVQYYCMRTFSTLDIDICSGKLCNQESATTLSSTGLVSLLS